jgi:hypothetical protein
VWCATQLRLFAARENARPAADSCTAANSLSFYKLVGAEEKGFRDRNPERFGGLGVS